MTEEREKREQTVKLVLGDDIVLSIADYVFSRVRLSSSTHPSYLCFASSSLPDGGGAGVADRN